jgi:hypothetical protein
VTTPAEADYLVKRLVAELRSLPLFVQRPALADPPVQAININFSASCVVAGATSFAGEVQWFGAPATTGFAGRNVCGFLESDTSLGLVNRLPSGLIAVVRAECSVGQVTTDTVANLVRQTRWSILLNGTPVSGFDFAQPGGITTQNPTAAAPKSNQVVVSRTDAPILVPGGGRLSFNVDATQLGGGTSATFHVQVHGWAFPQLSLSSFGDIDPFLVS